MHRAISQALLLLLFIGAPLEASAQLAGAPTATAAPAAPPPLRRASAKRTPLVMSDVESPPVQVASIAPMPVVDTTTSSHQTINNTTLSVSSHEAPASMACIPDCRAGWVCREGQCVSACNPVCGEGETCNAKRECVPASEASQPYPYDHVRFGGGFVGGMSTSSDGIGTPLGGLLSVSIPLKGHWYSREDIVATYSRTMSDDHPYIGGTIAPGVTPVEQTYILVALRATAGYQFASSFSARAGLFGGSHSLRTNHSMCGTGFVSSDNTSFAFGGTGGIAFTGQHVELAAVADVYSAETQALCALSPAGAYYAQPAILAPYRDIAAQVVGQLSFLF